MKKAKMMALTGILLSSTILGANTTVAKAADNKALTVDKSAITDVINVINELLDSQNTSNKVNAQTQFDSLNDGDTLTVAPIFGKQSPETFAKTLQGELNVIDSNSQLVPMTVSKSNSTTGFAEQVSYTLNGTTKTINVAYSLSTPTVNFKKGTVMNFTSLVEANKSLSSLVTPQTTNKDDANGHSNEATLTQDPSSITKSGSVNYTAKDNYRDGLAEQSNVNIYTLPTSVTDRDSSLAKNSFVVNNGGKSFLATPTGTSTSDKATYNVVAIDDMGNPVTDSFTGDTISGSATGNVTTNSDTTSIPYTVVFEDASTGQPVYTADTVGKTGDVIDKSSINTDLTNSGYTLSDGENSTYTLGTDDKDTNQFVFKVTKSSTLKINYVDSTTGKLLDENATQTFTGNNGAKKVLTTPKGYRLADVSELIQTLDSDQPSTKNVYVTPIKQAVKNLSYTVTFKDKDTGKTVGSKVNSEGALGDYVSLTAPEGYAFASILDNGFILLKNNQTVTKYVVAADTPYNISYVDQDTGKEVGTQAGKGADGSKIVLKSPDGYAFVNADDVNYEIDKDTPNATIYVQKSGQTVDNIVAGYPKNGDIKIYNEKGKLNNDVVLSEGSDWIIDKTLTINGAEYYRVATNEYVKASDVYKYTPLQTVAVTNGDNVTPVYNTKGQLIIDRALDVNTPWYTDRSATIRGKKMYRVATDEWIKASDSTLR